MLDENGVLIQEDDDLSEKKGTRVLGRDTIREIHAEMESLVSPSSLSSPPTNPGDKKGGKFTADQWTVFTSVILAGALIRLWGHKPADSWEFQYLTNYLHLIHAAELATGLSINETRIAEFEGYMKEYVQGLRTLFPGTSITIYQHLALHFGDQLRQFGPVHSWRCFPFERYNGMMQKLNTNFRFGMWISYGAPRHTWANFLVGQLEKTLFLQFCRNQNLKNVLRSTSQSQDTHLKKISARYSKVFHTNTRGTLRGDDKALDSVSLRLPYSDSFAPSHEYLNWDRKREKQLSSGEFELLRQCLLDHGYAHSSLDNLSARVFFRSKVETSGLCLQPSAQHKGNSQVLFRTSTGKILPGIIQKIFSHQRTDNAGGVQVAETFLLVTELTPLVGDDKARRSLRPEIAFFGACHVYDKIDIKLQQVVRIADAAGCFTRCKRNWKDTVGPVSYIRLLLKVSCPNITHFNKFLPWYVVNCLNSIADGGMLRTFNGTCAV